MVAAGWFGSGQWWEIGIFGFGWDIWRAGCVLGRVWWTMEVGDGRTTKRVSRNGWGEKGMGATSCCFCSTF